MLPIIPEDSDEAIIHMDDDSEGLPQFITKWEPAEDDEAMELDQVEPAHDTQ